MDWEMLRQRGLRVAEPRRSTLTGFRVQVGRRAWLQRCATSKAYGITLKVDPFEIHRLYVADGLADYYPIAVLAEFDDAMQLPVVTYTCLPGDDRSPEVASYVNRLRAVLHQAGLPHSGLSHLP
jgi:hypothetical protein